MQQPRLKAEARLILRVWKVAAWLEDQHDEDRAHNDVHQPAVIVE
jgi:hypothetical protein